MRPFSSGSSERQKRLWPGHTCADPIPNDSKLRTLVEEVGEVARELNDAENELRPIDIGKLREELVQTAAVALAWIEAL